MRDFSEKPVWWGLVGFGIASVLFLLVSLVTHGGDRDASASQKLEDISNQIALANQNLETMQQQLNSRALKEEELLLALGRLEEFVKKEPVPIPLTPVPDPQTPEAQKTLPDSTADPDSSGIKIKDIEEDTEKTSIELRVQPKHPQTGTQTKPALVAPARKEVPAAPAPKTHKVIAGDTLYSIARKNGVPLPKLLEANGLKEGATLSIGQSLVIPR